MRKKSAVLTKILFFNLLIPLLLGGVLREILRALYNPYKVLDLQGRLRLPIRPTTYLMVLLFGIIAAGVISLRLRPLPRFLDTGVQTPEARHAALRINWFLISIHAGLSFCGMSLLFIGRALRMFSLSRRVDRFQLLRIRERLEELNAAEGDLTRLIPLVNFDDVGRISAGTNAFIRELNSMIGKIRQLVRGLVNSLNERTLVHADTLKEATDSVLHIPDNIRHIEGITHQVRRFRLDGENESE